MSDQSARLGLPYVRAGQLQKHVTVNEALTRLDALVQTAIQSRSLSTPPPMAEEGQLFVIGGTPAGGWSGFAAGQLVIADIGGWRAVVPVVGQMAVIVDEQTSVVWSGSAWTPLGDWLGALSISGLGIGTSPDANNPFSARVNKALWAAVPTGEGGDGDMRFTFNKQAAGHTASMLFQSNWQGRAELGLTGDDDLRLKVSNDGSQWSEALRVDRSNGRLWFPKGATRREVSVMTASGTLSIPDWARWIEGICIGAGGGGGAGEAGTSGVRRGGGGGGAGGFSRAVWSVDHLGGSLTVTVGSAGAAGASGHGGAGGASSIETYGNAILRAGGGSGGQRGGAGGAGGMGEMPANSGASNAADGRADTAVVVCGLSAGAGGAGGGLSASNEVFTGSAGSAGGLALVTASAGSGGNGAAGQAGQTSPLPNISYLGGGGGGGGARSGGAGHAGGSGALYGAGGGGGGAGTSAGGQGGAGAAGLVILTVVG